MTADIAPVHYDDRETRSPAAREEAQARALPAQIAHARRAAPYYARLLADVDPATITSRAALARLPVTRKADLVALQRAEPPFGGLNALPPGALARLFLSPGPIFDLEPRGRDPWRTARALYAAGFRAGDVVLNCFSYHFTPAGSMFETGIHALGGAVIPAGTGATETQIQAITQYRPQGYVGTPDFLKVILEKADAAGADVGSLTRGHVTAGPLLPDLVAYYAGRGIQVFQSYGTADLGVIAYQTPARDGLVIDEDVLVELVRPGTGDPVAEGESGEVVVTSFDAAYPLVRFATGDLSAFMAGTSPCGRTNQRLKGWLGRADQTVKVKGLFVYPHMIGDVARRHPDLIKARLVVGRLNGVDTMLLRCETLTPATESMAEAIAESLQAVTKMRGRIALVPPGTLPTDGKTIEDTR